MMNDALACTSSIFLIATMFITIHLSKRLLLSNESKEFFTQIAQLITRQFFKIYLILHCRQHLGLPKGVIVLALTTLCHCTCPLVQGRLKLYCKVWGGAEAIANLHRRKLR